MNEVISTAVNGVEFDPRYSEIEFTLSEFDSQTDPLNAVDNARDINWHAIREQSAALLEQCFDLHVVLWFMRANLHIDGFSAVYQGITTIDGKYAEEGSTIFPQADMEPATDSFHAAALGWLATSSCLHEIKNSKIFPDTPLTTDELLNMRMDEQEGKSLHFSEVVKVLGQADSYFAGRNMPSLKEQLSRGIDALERVENYANLQAEDYRLDCRQVRDYLALFSRQLLSLEQQELPEEIGAAPADAEAAEVPATLTGKYIRSRQDVILLLDQVLDYFQNYEPSHPAPILIRRSQKMIGMDFATIVEELLPESLASLNQLSGK
ncbi:type VI secretion system ImpA family N-terminal domain-containing protein [Serratia nevei]|uniref:type VI secretion system protein TssA n=1 Tax=Serratia marcescens TaxID=615 RepID=UPI001A2C70DF|nr:type VI secretion system ImpA family N-terminal domain-containing protein [Serratia marcescens]MDF8322631.1 type VI secretion system ImpA family N-terminal domain-containing protein [Serratia nevei]MDF8339909.1 type VI secretion system ImpA family N-terminal domain-containing protein [Serratia nevei]MDF8342497.1 type VI secretion system ImpA family N-terminal domain-containing protein [Serratia nevei]MDF8350930.1 type VI secretion system ImpA family N-terminal domain-containing protein [Serr